MYLANAFVLL